MRQAGTPRRPNRGDTGSSFTEYAALILLVAAMFGAIAVAAIPGSVRDQIERALCAIEEAASGGGECTIDLGGDDVADGRDPEDFVPRLCERGSFYEAKSFNVKAIATFESETTIKRVELADGSVWYTAEPANKSVGAEVGAGGSLNSGGEFNGGGSAHVEASYDWGNGQIWTFDPDERDEADAFEQRLRDETSVGSNPVSALWNDWFGDDPDLPDSQMELDIKGGSVEASASYDTGVALDDLNGGKGEGGELDLGQGGGVDLGVAYQNITRTDRRDPDNVITSNTHQMTGSIGANGKIMLGAGASGQSEWTSGVREDRDENGDLQGIFINATFDRQLALEQDLPFGFSNDKIADAGPDVNADTDLERTVDNTQVYVEMDNEEDRRAGEAFLDDYGGVFGGTRYFAEALAGNHGYYEEEPGGDAEPWADLFYDKAQVWQSSHDREHTEWEMGGSARYGLFTFGGGYSEEEWDQSTDDAWYLGAPGEEGERETVRYDDCIADG